MKKFLVVFLLGLLIAGSAFAEWGYYGYNQPAQAQQTISGTLQIINGTLAIVNAVNQLLCYVPNLQPYYGVSGLYVNTFVTVYGTIANSFCSPSSFMVGGTWYILPGYSYNVPPVQPMYGPPVVVLVLPMYTYPQSCYPRYYGW